MRYQLLTSVASQMLASHCSIAVFLLLFELASEMVDITNANSATLRNSTNLLFKIKSASKHGWEVAIIDIVD